jgi:hypothetical protein
MASRGKIRAFCWEAGARCAQLVADSSKLKAKEKGWEAGKLEGWKAINSPPASGFALRAYVFADATPHRTTRQVARVTRLNVSQIQPRRNRLRPNEICFAFHRAGIPQGRLVKNFTLVKFASLLFFETPVK